MNQQPIDLKDRLIEQSLIDISTKIADAVEMVERAKEIIALSEAVLVKAHLDLEDLYTRFYEEPEVSQISASRNQV